MEIAVRNQQKTVRISPQRIAKVLRSALTSLARRDRGRFLDRRLRRYAGRPGRRPPAAVDLSSLEISVLMVNDPAMRRLNRTYRGKDRTTDVLSFPQMSYGNEPQPSTLLGDIVISLPQARRQAREYGVSLYEEVSRLLVHGLLHLLGYDHEQSRYQARVMSALEEELLREGREHR